MLVRSHSFQAEDHLGYRASIYFVTMYVFSNLTLMFLFLDEGFSVSMVLGCEFVENMSSFPLMIVEIVNCLTKWGVCFAFS